MLSWNTEREVPITSTFILKGQTQCIMDTFVSSHGVYVTAWIIEGMIWAQYVIDSTWS